MNDYALELGHTETMSSSDTDKESTLSHIICARTGAGVRPVGRER